jgi:hypothetical protein
MAMLLALEFLLIALLAALTPLGVELMLCTVDELAVAGDATKSRDIAAGLWERSTVPGGDLESLSSIGSKASVVVGSALYFVHSTSISRRERPLRFSRLAVRLSKQYAQ